MGEPAGCVCKTRSAGKPRLPVAALHFGSSDLIAPAWVSQPFSVFAIMASGITLETLSRIDAIEGLLRDLVAQLTETEQKVKGKSARAEAPREDTVPFPTIGWKTVQRRPRKDKSVDKKSEQPEEKKVPLKLYGKDWNVKVILREDLKLGTEGVCLTSDDHACDLIPHLGEQNLKLVLVTPGEVNDNSKKFVCLCFDLNQRSTKVTRWCTNVGKVKVTPAYPQEGNDTPKATLTNTTVKIVVQVVKKYSTAKDWESAAKTPANPQGQATRRSAVD